MTSHDALIFFLTFWSKPGDVIVVMISDRRGERDGEHMTDSRTARSFLCTYTGCTYILMVVPRYDIGTLKRKHASTGPDLYVHVHVTCMTNVYIHIHG